MALMAALNIAFALMASFVPLAGLFLAIALPLISALVIVKCDVRHYPIYAMATLGLALIVTMHQLETTIFYLLPALILGLFYGLLYKLRLPEAIIISITSFVQLGLLYLTIIMINGIFEIDFLALLALVLNLDSISNIAIIMPTLLYAISLAQATFTHLISAHELEKLEGIHNKPKPISIYSYLFVLVLALAIIPLGYIMPAISYLLLGPALLFSGCAVYDFVNQRRIRAGIIALILIPVTAFIIALLYPVLGPLRGLLSIALFPIGILSTRICDFYLPRWSQRFKMKPRGMK